MRLLVNERTVNVTRGSGVVERSDACIVGY